jgi:DNA repair protein RadD
MNFQNRDYQQRTIESVRNSFLAGHKWVLLQAGTGSGKTVMAGQIIERTVFKGKRAMFLVHRRQLVYQAARKFERMGIGVGIIMAGEESDRHQPVQVGSIQTLEARYLRKPEADVPVPAQADLFTHPDSAAPVRAIPQADIIVYDECHIGLEGQARLKEAYPNTIVLGLTATPVRSDGRGLGLLYNEMVCAPTIAELTDMGFLVPVKYFAPHNPDLTGIKITAGDYNERQLSQRMDTDKLVGDIVENWKRIAEGRRTIVFATSVAHSLHVVESFKAVGIEAAHIDAETPQERRDEIFADLKSGRITILSNYMVLSEGFDEPSIACCILARPTKSVALYLQMAGRILRPVCLDCQRETVWNAATCVHCNSANVKRDSILVDHSGSVFEHGYITEFVEWALDPNGKIQDRQKKAKKKKRKATTCEKCTFVFDRGRRCPRCGWEIPAPVKAPAGVKTKDGDLQQVTADAINGRNTKERWYAELLWQARLKNYKPGWARHQFLEKFKHWPDGMDHVKPQPVSTEVTKFLKHLNIRRRLARKEQPNA